MVVLPLYTAAILRISLCKDNSSSFWRLLCLLTSNLATGLHDKLKPAFGRTQLQSGAPRNRTVHKWPRINYWQLCCFLILCKASVCGVGLTPLRRPLCLRSVLVSVGLCLFIWSKEQDVSRPVKSRGKRSCECDCVCVRSVCGEGGREGSGGRRGEKGWAFLSSLQKHKGQSNTSSGFAAKTANLALFSTFVFNQHCLVKLSLSLRSPFPLIWARIPPTRSQAFPTSSSLLYYHQFSLIMMEGSCFEESLDLKNNKKKT